MLEILAGSFNSDIGFKVEDLPDLPARTSSPGVAASNGLLYIHGGRNQVGTDLGTMYSFDPATKVRTTLPTSPVRSYHIMKEIPGTDELVVFGGRNPGGLATPVAAKYNKVTGNWTNFANNASFPGRITPVGFVLNNYLYTFGGINTANVMNNNLTRLNLTTGVWENLPRNDVPPARYVFDGVLSKEDNLFYTGGGAGPTSTTTSLADFYTFNPVDNTWQRLADFPFPISGHLVSEVNGEIYVHNGTNHNTNSLNERVYRYDKTKNIWILTQTPNPNAFAGAGSDVIDDVIFVAGGATTRSSSTSVNKFYTLKQK